MQEIMTLGALTNFRSKPESSSYWRLVKSFNNVLYSGWIRSKRRKCCTRASCISFVMTPWLDLKPKVKYFKWTRAIGISNADEEKNSRLELKIILRNCNKLRGCKTRGSVANTVRVSVVRQNSYVIDRSSLTYTCTVVAHQGTTHC